MTSAAGPSTTGLLDEAFDRMASAGFQLPNRSVNHGAMACEALGDPGICYLHGVTAAMAFELMLDHISPPDAAAGLAQVRAEHAVVYAGAMPVEAGKVEVRGEAPGVLAAAAAASGDPERFLGLVGAHIAEGSPAWDPYEISSK